MITIISATNRTDSKSSEIAKYYSKKLNLKSLPNQIVDLKDVPVNYLEEGLYETNGRNPTFNVLRDKVENADQLIFVIAEYNGSFPGILKLFIDGLKFPGGIKGKTAAMIGVSSGPLGSALAMSHFTDILNYLNCNVIALKPRITSIHNAFVDGDFTDDFIKNLIDEQIDELIKH